MNGLQEEWSDQVLVLQVNVNLKESRPLVEEYNGSFTPTFVLFNKDGEEIMRSTGSIDAVETRQMVSALELDN